MRSWMRVISISLLLILGFSAGSTHAQSYKGETRQAAALMVKEYGKEVGIAAKTYLLQFELVYGGSRTYEEALAKQDEMEAEAKKAFDTAMLDAKVIGRTDLVKAIRVKQMMLFDAGAPTTTEPKYLWRERAQSIREQLEAAIAEMNVELESSK